MRVAVRAAAAPVSSRVLSPGASCGARRRWVVSSGMGHGRREGAAVATERECVLDVRPGMVEAPSTADGVIVIVMAEAMAEAASTADEVSKQRIASTADDVRGRCGRCSSGSCCPADATAEEADSAGPQVDAHTTGDGSAGTKTCQCVNRWRPCTNMQVFPFLFLHLYSNAISLLAQMQATESSGAPRTVTAPPACAHL